MTTTRIIHITDLHLSNLDDIRKRGLRGKRILGYASWRYRRQHIHKRFQLDRIIKEIKQDKADKILITGDLIHIGVLHEYIEAREFLIELGEPEQIKVVPGNHDTYRNDCWALARKYYGQYLMCNDDSRGKTSQSYFPKTEQHAKISLTYASTASVSPWWGANGKLGQLQIEKIKAALTKNKNNFQIFLLHHPPVPKMCSRRIALTDAADLEDILIEAKPAITLYGHLHKNLSSHKDYGRTYCTASASSVSTKDPASYRVFDITKTNDYWLVEMELKTLINEEIKTTNVERFIVNQDQPDITVPEPERES